MYWKFPTTIHSKLEEKQRKKKKNDIVLYIRNFRLTLCDQIHPKSEHNTYKISRKFPTKNKIANKIIRKLPIYLVGFLFQRRVYFVTHSKSEISIDVYSYKHFCIVSYTFLLENC